MTYEEHKAAVDAAHPTPTLAWYLHEDNSSHDYDDPAIADAFVAFDGEVYEYEVHYSVGRNPGAYTYYARRVGVEAEPRPALTNGIRTWEAGKAGIQAVWETLCEGVREVIAQEAQVKEILVADGITARPAPAPVLSPLATLGGIAPNAATLSHWTLAPVFDADTLAYAFTASNAQFLPRATKGHTGQTVMWKFGSVMTDSDGPNFTLVTGENVITITVISEDQRHSRVYTLTVTKE